MKEGLRTVGRVFVVCLVLTLLLVELGAAADVSKETKTVTGADVKDKEVIGKDVGASQITDVELVKGWNLVAFPVLQKKVTFGDLTVIVDGKTVKLRAIPNIIIFSYDPVKGRYIRHSMNDEISPTSGYFVYTTMPMRIDLSDIIGPGSLLRYVVLVDEPEDLQDLQPNTYYVLTEDLNFTGYPWHGIRFNYGDYNITIDCNGHEITADYDTDAIALVITTYYSGIQQPSNIVIKNCKIHHVNHGILTQGYLSGILYKPIENITVLNTEIYDTAKECILLEAHTNKFNLFNSTIHGCGWEGIRLEYGTNNTNIIGNYFYDVPLAVYQNGNDDYNSFIKNNTIICRAGGGFAGVGIRSMAPTINSIDIVNNNICCCAVDIHSVGWDCPFPGTCEESTIENNVCERVVTSLSTDESCEEGCFDNGYICCGCNAEITEAYIDDTDHLHLSFRFSGDCRPEQYEEWLREATVTVTGPEGSDSPATITFTSDDFDISGNTATLTEPFDMSPYHEGFYNITIIHDFCTAEGSDNFESERIEYEDDDPCVSLWDPETFGDNIIRIDDETGLVDDTTAFSGGDIDHPYTYYIVDDVTLCGGNKFAIDDSDGVVFVVNDSNINIDFNGQSIALSSPYTADFLVISGRHNVTVTTSPYPFNSEITGFSTGFRVSNSSGISISNFKILNPRTGVLFNLTNGSRIEHLNVRGAMRDAVLFVDSSGNFIRENQLYGMDTSIRLLNGDPGPGSNYNTIGDNTLGEAPSSTTLTTPVSGKIYIGKESNLNMIYNNDIYMNIPSSPEVPIGIEINSCGNDVFHNTFHLPTMGVNYVPIRTYNVLGGNMIMNNNACIADISTLGSAEIVARSSADMVGGNACHSKSIGETVLPCDRTC